MGDGRRGRWRPGYTEVVDPYGWYGTGTDPWWNPSQYLWKFPIWATITAGPSGAILTTPSGKGKLTIMPGVLSNTVTLEPWDAPIATAPRSDLRAGGRSVWLRVLEWLGPTTGRFDADPTGRANSFPQPVSINIRYSADEVRHLDTSQIIIHILDEVSNTWIPLPTSLDQNLKEATAQTSAAGIFNLQAPLLCPADHSEPNDTYDASTLLSANRIPSEHGFDIVEDEDWFRFAALAGGSYTVATDNLSTGVDTVIELYDQDGRTQLGADDNGNGGLASRLTWKAPSSGTYFVRIIRPSTGVYGCSANYDLSLTQELRIHLPLIQRTLE